MKLEDLLDFLNIDPMTFEKLNPSVKTATLKIAKDDDFNKVHQWGYILKGEIEK